MKKDVEIPGWPLALAAIFFAQMGSVVSKMIMEHIGPAGTAWARISVGAVVMLVIVRPKVRSLGRRDWWLLIRLGVSSALMSTFFLIAIGHIHLGMAISIEYLGPLCVGVAASRNRRALLWPPLALLGVVLVAQPWHATPNLMGITFSLGAGFFWSCYIIFTQRAGDNIDSNTALSLSMVIAAVTAGFFGIPQAWGHFTPGVILACLGLGLLHPLAPFALEMSALKRMNRNAFSTFTALAPAAAAILASLTLGEALSAIQWCGVAVVVTAGTLAQFGGGRRKRRRGASK